MTPPAHRHRALCATAATLAVLATTAGPAAADTLVASAPSCPSAAIEHPFARWLDPAAYGLIPDGAMEGGSDAWTLSGDAAFVAGNEPFHVHASSDEQSLALGSGGSATSATTCVGLDDPTLRFLARRTAGSPLANLRVDALFTTAGGDELSLPVGTVSGLTSSWSPTLPMALAVNLLTLGGDDTAVALRFTAQGSASWAIDDVYVDPFRTH